MGIKKLINIICCCFYQTEKSGELENNNVTLQVASNSSIKKEDSFKQYTSSSNALVKRIETNFRNREDTIGFEKLQDFGASSGQVIIINNKQIDSPKSEHFKDCGSSSSSSSLNSNHSEKDGRYIPKSKINEVKNKSDKADINISESSFVDNNITEITGTAQSLGDDDGWIV